MSWLHEHSETLLGLILGLCCSIPLGFYLSLYSGLIVARWAHFEDLRYQLIRILQCIDWPPDTNTFRLTGGYRLFDITLIAGDLFALGHSKGGDTVLRIEHLISTELNRVSPFLEGETKDREFSRWLRLARTMRPDQFVILNPLPRLHRKPKYDTGQDETG